MITMVDDTATDLLEKITMCIEKDGKVDDLQDQTNQFIIGIAVTIFTYNMVKYDASSVGNPFYPIEVVLPEETRAVESETELLTRNVFRHFHQICKASMFIDSPIIGKEWCKIINNFWTQWSHCFEIGISYDSMETMFCAAANCLQYVVNKNGGHDRQTLFSLENQANVQIARMCEVREKIGTSVDDITKVYEDKITDKFESLLMDLDELRSDAFSDVSRQSITAIDRVESIVSKAQFDIKNTRDTMSAQLKSQLATYVNTLTSEIESEFKVTMRRLMEEKINQHLEHTIGNMNHPVLDQVRKISEMTESCRRSARDARVAASEVKSTVQRKRSMPRRPIPETPKEQLLEQRISRLEAVVGL